jgi:hypothetical protein
VDRKAVEAHYRILMIPMKNGDPMPEISYDRAKDKATVKWPDQTDVLHFETVKNNRTAVRVMRGGKAVVEIE